MSTKTIDVVKCSNFLYEGFAYHGFNSVKEYEIETNPLNFMEKFNNKTDVEAYFWKGEHLK